MSPIIAPAVLPPVLATDDLTETVRAPDEYTASQTVEFWRFPENPLNNLQDMLDARRNAFRMENDNHLLQWDRLLEFEQKRLRRLAALEVMVCMNPKMRGRED